MPAPSTWAQRMADDLVEVGTFLGFQATKEEPPVDNSAMRIDVVWKIHMPSIKTQMTKTIPIPENITVVSIEIQYSKSDASISHGLVKGQYANSPYHIIASYYPLPGDFRDALYVTKPKGLIILDGKNSQDLQSWTSYLLREKEKDTANKEISQKVYKAILDNPTNMEEGIRESIKEDVKLLFTPMKIQELYENVSSPIGDGQILSQSIEAAIKFVKELLGKYKFSKTISISSNKMFRDPAIAEGIYANWEKYNIVISSEKVYLHIGYSGYDNKIIFEARNAFIKDNEEKTLMWESIPTEKVKLFVLEIMEAARNYISTFVVNSNDLKELEQTISTIKNLKDNLNHQS